MPTNEERREVAQKLKSWEWKAVSPKCLLNLLAFGDECPGTDDDPDTITCQECECMAAHRLADFIEPEPERTCKIVYDSLLSEQYGGPMCRCSYCKAALPKEFVGPYYYCPCCGAKAV